MTVMRFPEPKRAELVDVPIPRPQTGEVLIRVKAAGICASDVGAFLGKHDVRKPPVIISHELVGEIVELGPGSRARRVGERVAVEPHVGCGACVFCLQGHCHECLAKRFIGVGEWIGAFAEYVVATESTCHPMPECMSFEEGALLEPFCVELHAVRPGWPPHGRKR